MRYKIFIAFNMGACIMKKYHFILLKKSQIINSLKIIIIISLLLTISIIYLSNKFGSKSLNAYNIVPFPECDKPSGRLAIVIDDFGQDTSLRGLATA